MFTCLEKLFVGAGFVDPGNRILTPGSHLCICHIVGTMMFFVGWGYKHGRQSVPQTCVVLQMIQPTRAALQVFH